MDFVSLLVKRYVGPVATRALWQWAGGRDGDLAFVDEPAAQWSALWARAAAGPVTRIALVREALFDSPGDPELLAALAALAERPPDAAVLELVEALESLLNHGCEDAALWLCLAGFKPRGFDVTYAALAAAVEGRLAPGAREALEAVLPRLLTVEAMNASGRPLWCRFGPSSPSASAPWQGEQLVTNRAWPWATRAAGASALGAAGFACRRTPCFLM